MTDVDTGIRARLNTLLETIVDDKTEGSLLDDGILPYQFLQDNGIRVIAHDFENTSSETGHSPPILFEPRPSKFLEDYPINPKLLKEKEPLVHYMEQTEAAYKDWSLPDRVSVFSRASADYLYGWAYGTGDPRDLPSDNPDMFQVVGIKPVEGNHGLYLGFDVFDSAVGQKYTSHVLEYRSEAHGVKPHVLLLGAQSNIGHNGSIMFGELSLIVSAMRNRAYQPSMEIDSDESDIEVNIEGEEDLLFKDEHRFPVLMVSIVGPQHGRIFYACMNGLDLVIRQSQLYSLENKNDTTLNILSSFLLSKPLHETPTITEALPAASFEIFQELDNLSVSPVKMLRKSGDAHSAGSSDKENI